MASYTDTTKDLRDALPPMPDLSELVRYATLAANGHNTQPWLFEISRSRIDILPDFSRRTPVVDPDDHHLYVSLGCAAENLILAAKAHGRAGSPAFDRDGSGAITIDLALCTEKPCPLYAAIPERQSTRSEFDGRSVPFADLMLLEKAATENGVSVELITDEKRLEQVLEQVIAGNSAQMDDPAFVNELKQWVRFNEHEALRTGDGLFSGCSGNPVLPGWVARPLFSLLFRKTAENGKYAKQVRSSSGIAIFTGDRPDKDHWVRVGRSFQRFALQATALGIRHSHINQPVEVPAVRTAFAQWLGQPDARPDLVIRFGYSSALPMSIRRPVEQVVTKQWQEP